MAREGSQIHQASVMLQTRSTPQVTLGDLIRGQDDASTCSSNLSLVALAQQFVQTGRTCAGAVNQQGEYTGLICEADILQAYLRGVPWDCTVEEWLRGCSGSRNTMRQSCVQKSEGAAATELSVPGVHSALALQEAVPYFARSDTEGKGGFGSAGNLVVPSPTGRFCGVLSSLDVLRAVTKRESAAMGDILGAEGSDTVADVMVPLSKVPMCCAGSTTQQFVQAVLDSPEHVACVADQQGTILGLVTAPDALWAFCQRICQSDCPWGMLAGRQGMPRFCHRIVNTDMPVRDAIAQIMSDRCTADGKGWTNPLRHLVVVGPDRREVVGVVSPLNIFADDAPRLSHVTSMKARMWLTRHPLTVGDVAAQRETPTCSVKGHLGDACVALIASSRTATVVMEGKSVRGVLTENDILKAFVCGESWDCSIQAWLRGGDARLPGFLVPVLTLPPSATLAEAASVMAYHATKHTLSLACHHLLIRDAQPTVDMHATAEDAAGEQTRPVRLLSALDIAVGMMDAPASAHEDNNASDSVMADLTVEEAMKALSRIPRCSVNKSVSDAFAVMVDSEQNCALVMGASEHQTLHARGLLGADGVPICGVITPSDTLLAVSGGATRFCNHTSLGSWLCSLDTRFGARIIAADAHLKAATTHMASTGVHHLVVVAPGGTQVVGLLSALDIVCAVDKFCLKASEQGCISQWRCSH